MIGDSRSLAGLLPALHCLALRGAMQELPGDVSALIDGGLVVETRAGFMLTGEGRDTHAHLIAEENSTADPQALRDVYDRFLAINGDFKKAASKWMSTSEDDRFALLDSIGRYIDRVKPSLTRTAELLPRFGTYPARLTAAFEKAEGGEADYVVSPRVDSVHSVWMEAHEDYLQTLGISREEEGSY